MEVEINEDKVIDEVVNTWVEVSKIPTIVGGFYTENDNFLNLSTQWSVMDVTKKENVSFQRSFSILKSSLAWNDGENLIHENKLIMNSTAAVPVDGKKICVSNNGNRKCILLEKSDSSGSKTQILQIWNLDTLEKTYDLTDLDKHKDVYTAAGIGNTMAWSPNSNKLAYLAEKKVSKPKPFFKSNIKKENDKKPDEIGSSAMGEEFALRQTWGEQLKDIYNSVIAILDVENDNLEVLELPNDEFPTDLQWLNDSTVVGTSYKIPIWRLGLIYCTNRESRIFQMGIDEKNLRFLSNVGRAAFCPRVRPNGNFVIWQERAVDAPHDRSRSIMAIKISDENPGNPCICIYESVPPNAPIYLDFPKKCWATDSSKFLVITPKEGILTLLEISVTDKGSTQVKEILNESPGVDNLVWIGEKYMLISRSSSLLTPSLELVEISRNHRRATITNAKKAIPNSQIITKNFYGKSTAPSIYIGPEISTVKPNSVPLIVFPHGGPHTSFLDNFTPEVTFFSRLGFAVIKINYIGSLGSKTDETDILLGHIGSMDVNDCQNIAEQVVKSVPYINAKQIVVFGGSHGGFLSAQLSSNFPDFYKAAVIRNPVCDLNVMIGTSDITDWQLAETGLPFPKSPIATIIPAARSEKESTTYLRVSPIANAEKVKAPTLLLLGSEDLRVPMTQGMAYYRALKAYNKIAEVRVYPDCHPLSTVPVKMDSLIHSILWFKKFLK